MANTYTQLGIHIVTAVSGRQSLISKDIRKRVEAFIKDIVYGRDHVVFAIYVMANHMHVFISLNPKDAISDLVAAFKSQSSGFIQREFIEGFSWQRGYGAFAVSKSNWDVVIRYIENQEEHHRAQTLEQEIRDMLNDQDVEYDEQYLFDEVGTGCEF